MQPFRDENILRYYSDSELRARYRFGGTERQNVVRLDEKEISPATPDASFPSSVPVTPSNNQTAELAPAPDKTPNRNLLRALKNL